MKDALIVVDAQNDFLPGGSQEVLGASEVISPIAKLAGSFDLLVLTQLWHPPSHISFASTHGAKIGESIWVDGQKIVLKPETCVSHSQGAQIHPMLRGLESVVVQRGTHMACDGKSGFFDQGGAHQTLLEPLLRYHEVKQLYICGLNLETTLYHTVKDAIGLGWPVTVLFDLCRAQKATEARKSLQMISELGANLTTSSSLATALV